MLFKKEIHNIIASFVVHMITTVLATNFLLLAYNSNEQIAWFLVIFLMCRIILFEDGKKYLEYKRRKNMKKLYEEFKKDE